MKTEVLSVTDNSVTIRCTPYDITFERTINGKVVKRRFTLWGSRMEGFHIPTNIFNSAIKRAIAVFAGRSKRMRRSQERLF